MLGVGTKGLSSPKSVDKNSRPDLNSNWVILCPKSPAPRLRDCLDHSPLDSLGTSLHELGRAQGGNDCAEVLLAEAEAGESVSMTDIPYTCQSLPDH